MATYRRDALPEEMDWHDTGCEVSPRCLSCPLPACRYDVIGGARRLRNLTRDPLIREAYEAGEPPTAIAARLGLSRRTVFRVISMRS